MLWFRRHAARTHAPVEHEGCALWDAPTVIIDEQVLCQVCWEMGRIKHTCEIAMEFSRNNRRGSSREPGNAKSVVFRVACHDSSF
jgi:hypothetical protein